jgi:hypothetical protein
LCALRHFARRTKKAALRVKPTSGQACRLGCNLWGVENPDPPTASSSSPLRHQDCRYPPTTARFSPNAIHRPASRRSCRDQCGQSHRWRLDLTAVSTTHHHWLRHLGQQAYSLHAPCWLTRSPSSLEATDDLRTLVPVTMESSPAVVTTLRMCTAPPLARDRLVALASTERRMITAMESGRLPARMSASENRAQVARICQVLPDFLDPELFPWLGGQRSAEPRGHRTCLIVADRQCEAAADRILRHARRRHQLHLLREWLWDRTGRGLLSSRAPPVRDWTDPRAPVEDLASAGI